MEAKTQAVHEHEQWRKREATGGEEKYNPKRVTIGGVWIQAIKKPFLSSSLCQG